MIWSVQNYVVLCNVARNNASFDYSSLLFIVYFSYLCIVNNTKEKKAT